jgi:uncharacterized membrane protein YeaQ/YmgE (transglycosylase-associated protein family)
VIILAIILFGMLIGALAQLILRQTGGGVDWGMALGAGLIGSFVGGLLINLVTGNGLDLQASGIIGSLIGAVIVTLVWQWFRRRQIA